MRLTLRYHDVNALAFGAPQLDNGLLTVDADALRAELLTDPRIASVEVQRSDRSGAKGPLVVQLPGGARLELSDPGQVEPGILAGP